MSAQEVPSQLALTCPAVVQGTVCGTQLFVRHIEGGPIDPVRGTHFVTTITWQAECHTCQWESPKRSTPWALIRTVENFHDTGGN